VLEFDGDLDFVQQLFFGETAAQFRNLERNSRLVNRVESPVDVGQRAGRDAAYYSIFAELLPGA
jgi:hypothetical protein